MATSKTHRLDVRLDEEHRQSLDRITAERGITATEFVRDAIDQAERAARVARVKALLEQLQREAEAATTSGAYDGLC
ncbi:MAG TPA: hypothetical protein PKD27_14815 [Tepidiformaceae bacterium]|nr:hypothetical protein [Tepidiformaceae bacterium]